MRGLAITTPQRDARLPQVPSAGEAGLPDFLLSTWTGFYAPRGTPRDLVRRINRDIVSACNDPQLLARFDGLGGRPVISTPEEFAAFTRSEIERWGKIIKGANIKLD
jgi:tripartite-type tricarboxylate transporter receptor subunit TctC